MFTYLLTVFVGIIHQCILLRLAVNMCSKPMFIYHVWHPENESILAIPGCHVVKQNCLVTCSFL